MGLSPKMWFTCLIYFLFLVYQVFTPLVEKCKKYGRAMRIGTNHGSLSDRIMSYYGDSPRGMVNRSFVKLLEDYLLIFFIIVLNSTVSSTS